MTKQEIQTIRNIISRLQSQNLGCSNSPAFDDLVEKANAHGLEVAARYYLESWVIGPLECLLPEQRNPALAVSLSGR